MDYTSLKNVADYTASLVDYMGKGKTNYFSSVSQNLINRLPGSQTAQSAIDGYTSVNITLSEDAQKLLASGTTDSSGKANVSGVQKTAQNFMLSFFDQAGVDFSELTPQALDLIEGLQGVISGAGASVRDMATDIAEEKYNPDKKVYTLMGQGTRLRLAIEYADGIPSKLSVTDISGGQVETAEITLQTEKNKLVSMTIDRTQRQYANGHMTTLDPIEPLVTTLYKKA
jgi:hypothetical protein